MEAHPIIKTPKVSAFDGLLDAEVTLAIACAASGSSSVEVDGIVSMEHEAVLANLSTRSRAAVEGNLFDNILPVQFWQTDCGTKGDDQQAASCEGRIT